MLDKQGLKRWRDALEAVGLRAYEVHSEILLLPCASGEWSLAWHGGEGFVRTGEFEGAATDGGDEATPPLSLRMMLEEAQREPGTGARRRSRPASAWRSSAAAGA